MLRRRPWLALSAAVFGALWLVPGALIPLVVGNAVDHGIAGGNGSALLWLAGAVVAIGLVQAVCGTTLEFIGHGMWIHAAATTQRAVAEHTARLGASLRPQADTGEVMAIPASDLDDIGDAFEMFGRLVGAVIAFLTVGFFLLGSSPLLGVVALVGVPLAVAGTITVGELVAFYGAAAFLVIPVSAGTEGADTISASLVAAKKVCGVLRLRPLIAEPDAPLPLPSGALELYDSTSGITAVAGKLTVLDLGADAEPVAARLARFADPPDGHRVLVSGVPADRVALTELRRRVVYAHNQDLWFSGILRDEVAPDHDTGVEVRTAIAAADAEDIVLALPNGLDELIGERGREVSGGQRQRLSLARALALDADVLLLDEPTSAVDAHTEARITERVAELRRGKTTVVFSQSPLWRAVADERVTR